MHDEKDLLDGLFLVWFSYWAYLTPYLIGVIYRIGDYLIAIEKNY